MQKKGSTKRYEILHDLASYIEDIDDKAKTIWLQQHKRDERKNRLFGNLKFLRQIFEGCKFGIQIIL